MNSRWSLAIGILVFGVSLAQAKGRRPGEESFDYSRVKRGSPANPTSSYQPPRFNTDDVAPFDSSSDAEKATPARTKKKKESPAAETPQESWTLDNSGAQSTVQPTATPPAPGASSSSSSSGSVYYEPPLPDEPPIDPQAPAKTRK